MKTFDFTIIGRELTKFIQDDFSSWYIEFTKADPNRAIAIEVLKRLLVILHPFMPFITDHIYSLIDGKELLDDKWQSMKSEGNVDYINDVIEITKSLREFRVRHSLSNSIELNYCVDNKLEDITIDMINRLTNSSYSQNRDAKIPMDNHIMYIKLSDEMKEAEVKRHSKQIKYLKSEIKRAEGMLSNKRFTEKAPMEKVQEERNKLRRLKKDLFEIKGDNIV